jgi:hypothetical protein
MTHSVAKALGSTLLLLIARSNVGYSGRGLWSMALGPIQWAVGRECGKGLDRQGYFFGKAYVGVTGRGRNLDIGCRAEISRKKTVLRTKILQNLIV